MGILGNSGHFSRGNKASCVRVALPNPTSRVSAVFVCDHTTGCESYSFTTDGYGIFNVRTNLGTCRTRHTKGGQAQTRLHKS